MGRFGRARLVGQASILALLACGVAHAQTPPADSRAPTPPPPADSHGPPPVSTQANPDATPNPPGTAAPQAGGNASDAAAGQESEVVVTGFRGSLNRAIDTKRQSVGVVDSIKAEDIAAFPDLNLAESIQRIPGVSIARDAGEGRQLTVRGLGPDFTRVRINGVEANATVGSTDAQGGNNRSRSFDFNVFASELFSDITVRKTPEADVEEGSLGATVDLHTSRPFDFNKPTLVVSGQAGYNDLSNRGDPKIAALASNTWMDGKFGALVSVAYTVRHIRQEGTDTTRWDNGPSSGGFCPPTSTNCGTSPAGVRYGGSDPTAYALASAATTFHPRLPRYDDFTYEEKRLGMVGALQYKPDDNTLISLDLLYSDFKENRQEDDFETISWGRTASQNGKPQTSVLSAVVNPSNGELVQGTFNGVDVRSEERVDQLETDFKQATLSASHKFNDQFSLSALVGISRSAQTNPVQTTVTIDRPNTQGYSYDFTDDRHPALNYGFDVTNPANFEFGAGPLGANQSEIRLRPNSTYNDYRTGQLDGTYTLNDNFNVQAGFEYKDFRFKTTQFYRLVAETTTPALPAGVTLANLTHVTNGITSGDLPAGTPASWLSPDVGKFAQAFNIYCNCGTFALTQTGNSTAAGNNRGVEEADYGGYVQGNFKFDLLGLRFRGNAGVRYVDTNQASYGYQYTTQPVLVSFKRSYDDWLPSFNLATNLRDDFIVRLAAAKVLVRPGLGSLTPGGTINVTGSNRTVSSGNPELDPFRAKTVDMSFEWYFNKQSLLSLGLFYKSIDSFNSTLMVTQPLTAAGIPASAVAGYGLTGNEDFIFSQPVNSPGGDLKGLEINYQQPFRFLPWYFKNLGVLANYTYVDSKVQYVKTANPVTYVVNDLTGLSRNAANATLYYDDGRADFRISVAYRDKYLTQVPGSNNNDVYGTNSTLNLDIGASYAVTPHLKLTFDAINITDEYNDQFVDSTNRVNYYNHTGRQYYVGFRYQF